MRAGLLTAAVALLVVSSGCLGLVTGDEVAFEASPATVDDSTLADSGYELSNTTEQNITRRVSVLGQERTIRLENHITQYRRGVDLGPLGTLELSRVVVFSTPSATVAGQDLNPATTWSNRRVIEEIAARTGSVSDVQFERNRSVEVLGEPRDVSVFSGTTRVQGQEIDVRIHVTSFEHEGDVIVLLAVHPDLVSEQERVDTMFRGVEHSGNED
ncbi:DUF6517 family protein [Haloarcula marina]|uniref:DUF6517 family protein n=1 Tax=Haloarcula marina TaxID=2961574 RepID=UPI0020B7A345|nr:DUF6517 family protein [Halomicroarcula marina]